MHYAKASATRGPRPLRLKHEESYDALKTAWNGMRLRTGDTIALDGTTDADTHSNKYTTQGILMHAWSQLCGIRRCRQCVDGTTKLDCEGGRVRGFG